jgi:uncharacterized integral membrane protein
MKGLKIIPMFLFLIILTYFGVLFVQANGTEVIIKLGTSETPPTPIGFVVLTSVLLGMFVCGIFCSIELLALHMQNRKLRRYLPQKPTAPAQTTTPVGVPPQDVNTQRTSGRFT